MLCPEQLQCCGQSICNVVAKTIAMLQPEQLQCCGESNYNVVARAITVQYNVVARFITPSVLQPPHKLGGLHYSRLYCPQNIYFLKNTNSAEPFRMLLLNEFVEIQDKIPLGIHLYCSYVTLTIKRILFTVEACNSFVVGRNASGIHKSDSCWLVSRLLGHYTDSYRG